MGSPEAQYWLGRMYYEGRGLPKDYNRAIQWLSSSSGQGYQPASHYLESDSANRQEMARAKAAYQQELERHADQVERIRQNPKYDLVNYLSGAPRRFSKSSTEREAYSQFHKNLSQGYSLRAAASKAWEDVGVAPRASPRASSQSSSGSIFGSATDPRDRLAIARATQSLLGNRFSTVGSPFDGWSSLPTYWSDEQTLRDRQLEAIQGSTMGF